jgi:hypothetical protein
MEDDEGKRRPTITNERRKIADSEVEEDIEYEIER